MGMNLGVRDSPIPGPKGKDLSFTSGGSERKAMELGGVSFVEMALLFLFIYHEG